MAKRKRGGQNRTNAETNNDPCTSVKSPGSFVLHDRATGSKAEARVTSQNKVTVIEFDGCIIKNSVACDYVLETDEKALYLELKGSDVKRAFEQIEASIRYYDAQHASKVRLAAISYTGRVARTDVQQVTKMMNKRYPNIKFCKGTSRLELQL